MTCLIAVLGIVPRLAAKEFAFDSGERRVGLLELYTSEGCSSCPPAEAWLADLRGDPALWREFVPVSFHVNYWDRLGWTDRFSSQLYTLRQYAYARSFGSDSVYTPCFILDGREWHPGRGERPRSGQSRAGRLRVAWNGRDRIRVSFDPPVSQAAYEAYVALLGGGLSSRVTAGENAGARLSHEFVVLSLSRMPLEGTAGGSCLAETAWQPVREAAASRFAVAVWVARRGEVDPIQATGGWIE